MQAARFTDSCGSRKQLFCMRHGSESGKGHFCQLEAVNGVPIAVKEKRIAAVKGEPMWQFRWN
jgi:hypothetical protein